MVKKKRCLTSLVRSFLSPSQGESTPHVPPTTLGDDYPSRGICGRHCNLDRQRCTRVRWLPAFFCFWLWLTVRVLQAHRARRFFRVFRPGFRRVARNDRTAEHHETRSVLLFC